MIPAEDAGVHLVSLEWFNLALERARHTSDHRSEGSVFVDFGVGGSRETCIFNASVEKSTYEVCSSDIDVGKVSTV